MSRIGPEYVTSESELFDDLRRKRKDGDISETTAEAFADLYEFAKEIGDRVTVGGAKNANFQLKIDAHQSNSGGDPSVFTANVNGELQIWPARKPLENDPDLSSIGWDEQDYGKYEREFQSLRGVPTGSVADQFEALVENNEDDRFEKVAGDFVSTCQRKASEPQ